ncbi:MAG: hypothetical protein U9M96_04060 [Thermodesulfobacteriota bacterium]|nr:hypothetical protein [Thermodesulfobacteriota bacterium]
MSKVRISSIHLPKPLLLSLWVLVAAITYKSFNLLDADYDLWWHILMGKDVLSRFVIERFDLFSFTAAMEPVFNHEWLSEIIMAFFYTELGEKGLIFWRYGMTLSIILLALNLVRIKSSHSLGKIVVFLCFVLVIRPGISFRVQLFTFVLLLVLINMIYISRDRGKLPGILPVSVLFFVWSNLHGAFVLGLLVWYIYVGEAILLKKYEEGFVRILLLLFIPLLLTLGNPYGINLWWFIFSELSNPFSSKYITEWQRFSFEARELSFLGVCVLTWFSYFFSQRKKDVAETCVLLLASLMGFMAVRNTPLFVILAFPSMAVHIDGLINRILKTGNKGKDLSQLPIYIVSLLLIIFAVLFVCLGIPEKFCIRVDNDPLPVQSVVFIKKNNLKGNLWVPLHWGGYVLYHLYPDIKVSIDGRWAMVYPHDVMKDNMEFAYEGIGNKWKRILEKNDATFALVETSNPSFVEMGKDHDWKFIFKEKVCGILVKSKFLELRDKQFIISQKKLPAWP